MVPTISKSMGHGLSFSFLGLLIYLWEPGLVLCTDLEPRGTCVLLMCQKCPRVLEKYPPVSEESSPDNGTPSAAMETKSKSHHFQYLLLRRALV